MKINRIFLLLLFFALASFFIRSYFISQNLFFGPEQGIDFAVIKSIVVDHKLTLIGAKTDVSGVFHGPIYYYLATIPFIYSGGDPLQIVLFFIGINCLTVFLIFYLGKLISGERLGLIASAIFSVSFLSSVYPRWLSAHPLAIPLTVLFFVFFYSFLKGDRKSLFFASIALGLVCQVEFLNIIFFWLMAVVMLVLYRKRFLKEKFSFLLICFLTAFVFTFGNYLLFDLKHQFVISKSVLGLLAGGSGYHTNATSAIQDVFGALVRVFTFTVFPINNIAGGAVLLGSILFLIKRLRADVKKYFPLFLWMVAPLVVLLTARHSILDQFFVIQIPLYILIAALLIDSLWKFKKVFFFALAFVVALNFVISMQKIPVNEEIFFQSTQPGLRYPDQIKTIDRIYKLASNKPFSFQSYTIPYWSQQGWEYLFWYYGNRKYGYAPIELNAKQLFVIIQDDPSNTTFQNDWLKNTVSKWGKESGSFRFGILKTLILKV